MEAGRLTDMSVCAAGLLAVAEPLSRHPGLRLGSVAVLLAELPLGMLLAGGALREILHGADEAAA
jgi:hypothetical protein